MENTKEFKINDFYQAVILKTVGYPLLRLEQGNGNYLDFVFKVSPEEAEKVLQQYWAREIKVVARDLVENINELKTRIHSGV